MHTIHTMESMIGRKTHIDSSQHDIVMPR